MIGVTSSYWIELILKLKFVLLWLSDCFKCFVHSLRTFFCERYDLLLFLKIEKPSALIVINTHYVTSDIYYILSYIIELLIDSRALFDSVGSLIFMFFIRIHFKLWCSGYVWSIDLNSLLSSSYFVYRLLLLKIIAKKAFQHYFW